MRHECLESVSPPLLVSPPVQQIPDGLPAPRGSLTCCLEVRLQAGVVIRNVGLCQECLWASQPFLWVTMMYLFDHSFLTLFSDSAFGRAHRHCYWRAAEVPHARECPQNTDFPMPQAHSRLPGPLVWVHAHASHASSPSHSLFLKQRFFQYSQVSLSIF